MKTFWQKAKASWTMWWGTVLAASGVLLDPTVLAFLGTPEATDIVTYYGGPYAAHILKAFGVITWFVRAKGLLK